MFTKVFFIISFSPSVSFGRKLKTIEEEKTNTIESNAFQILESIEIQQRNQELIIRFTAFEKIFDIKLIKANTPSTVVLLENINGDLMEEESNFLPIFIDEETETSITLIKNKNDGNYSIEGTVGDDLMIYPMKSETKNKHIVTQLKSKDLANDYLIPETVKNTIDDNQRRRRSAPSVVRPEVLVVVDSTLYDKLGKDTSAINQYIRNFWSAVNLRFKTISNPKVELNIAGIFIAKTPASHLSSRTVRCHPSHSMLPQH